MMRTVRSLLKTMLRHQKEQHAQETLAPARRRSPRTSPMTQEMDALVLVHPIRHRPRAKCPQYKEQHRIRPHAQERDLDALSKRTVTVVTAHRPPLSNPKYPMTILSSL